MSETLDGKGFGDHDQPYSYRKPHTQSPHPFTFSQFAKLLTFKSKVHDPANVRNLIQTDATGEAISEVVENGE